MDKINLKEAENHLAELIKKAALGEKVIIEDNDGANFQIIPIATNKARPKFGSARGLIKMSDDFDKPLPDFEEYAPYKR